MLQESANELRESNPKLPHLHAESPMNNINMRNINDKQQINSPSLKCTDTNVMTCKEPVIGYDINAGSNNHTPLLLSETANDHDNITDIEDNMQNDNTDDNTQELLDELLDTNNDNEIDSQEKLIHTNVSDDEIENNKTNEASDEQNQIQLQIQSLYMYRQQYLEIPAMMDQPGLKYYYIDPIWYSTFLKQDFNDESFVFETQLGHVKTFTNETFPDDMKPYNFVSYNQFKFLLDIFNLENDHLIYARETVYSHFDDAIILDLYPLTIFPHIFCNNPSQINRYSYNQNQINEFQISSYYSIADLFHYMIKFFDLQVNIQQMRLWVVEFETSTLPLVIIPSTLQMIKRKKLISKKKKKLITLSQRGIGSCHLMVEIKQNDGIYYMDVSSHVLQGSGKVGLNNLGNTCYMNSALQCLMHIPELNYYFLYQFFEKELNKDNPLGNAGKVAISFGNLISSMFDNKYSGNQSSFAPRDFKYTIGHFNSLFAGYHQQDSQEFIAYLLDGLHEDLNRVLKKPYVEKPELKNGEENDSTAIKSLAQKCWDAHKLRNNSVIVDLFVALYKSTLVCPVCERVSITFDPYNDLTLPLPITKKWIHKVKILSPKMKPKILEIQLSKSASYYDLKQTVAKYINIPTNDLIGVEILRNTIYKNFEDSSSDSRYLPLSELISNGDDIWFYEVPNQEKNIIIPVFSTVVSNTRNNFALPFFLSLSEEECRNYAAIEGKMLEIYAQLSTSALFNAINQTDIDTTLSRNLIKALECEKDGSKSSEKRELEDEKTEIKDYEDDINSEMEEESYSERNENDVEIKNVSVDCEDRTLSRMDSEMLEDGNNDDQIFREHKTKDGDKEEKEKEKEEFRSTGESEPTIFSIDSIFVSKIADSSYDKVYYNRHYKYGSNSHSKTQDLHPLFWFPENHNTILRDDLPTLIQRKKTETPKADENMVIEEENDDQDENFYKDQMEYCLNNDNAMDNNSTNKPESSIVVESFKKLYDYENSPDIDEYVTAPESDTGSVERIQSSNVKSLATSSSLVKLNNESSSSFSLSPLNSEDSKEESVFLKPNMVIVNEFNENSFDLCFCNSSDNKYNGSETWSSPELLINEELVKESELNAENARKPVTIYDCLELFSKPEVLGQNDLWYCPQCKEHRQAVKKIELWSAPDILTIHLKRFESSRSFSDKIDIVVDYPIEGFDLTKYVADQDGEHIYDLFAVDNHYGGLGGGHYTAYVKNFVDNKWYYYDDSRVTHVEDPTESIKGSAYLLFYRKRSSLPLGGEFFQEMEQEIQKKRDELQKTLEETQNNRHSSVSETSDEDLDQMTQENPPDHQTYQDGPHQNYDKDECSEKCKGNDDCYKRRKLADGSTEPSIYEENNIVSTEEAENFTALQEEDLSETAVE
jgi:ubiquitin carboxyl-terminal hydrolase 4/11/15